MQTCNAALLHIINIVRRYANRPPGSGRPGRTKRMSDGTAAREPELSTGAEAFIACFFKLLHNDPERFDPCIFLVV